ncbi:MAG: hypothetical protein KKE00_11690 [Proteobacteria bacterium]|nr:hypothetical protein [Pseudomonadota bacterium]
MEQNIEKAGAGQRSLRDVLTPKIRLGNQKLLPQGNLSEKIKALEAENKTNSLPLQSFFYKHMPSKNKQAPLLKQGPVILKNGGDAGI